MYNDWQKPFSASHVRAFSISICKSSISIQAATLQPSAHLIGWCSTISLSLSRFLSLSLSCSHTHSSSMPRIGAIAVRWGNSSHSNSQSRTTTTTIQKQQQQQQQFMHVAVVSKGQNENSFYTIIRPNNRLEGAWIDYGIQNVIINRCWCCCCCCYYIHAMVAKNSLLYIAYHRWPCLRVPFVYVCECHSHSYMPVSQSVSQSHGLSTSHQ